MKVIFFIIVFLTIGKPVIFGQTPDIWLFNYQYIEKMDTGLQRLDSISLLPRLYSNSASNSWFCDGGNGSYYAPTLCNGFSLNSDTNLILKYNPVNQVFKDLNFAIPKSMTGGFIKAGNGYLYGLAGTNGNYGHGAIIRINPLNDSVSVIYSFKGDSLGDNPVGGLTDMGNNKLAGVTKNGGHSNGGVFFVFDLQSNTYEVKAFFNTNTGTSPTGSPVKAFNGKYYGMTTAHAAEGNGSIFEYNPATNHLANIYSFTQQTGYMSYHNFLTLGPDSNIYGISYRGGTYNQGALFRIHPQTHLFQKLFDFQNADNGAYPIGKLLLASNNRLYGTLSFSPLSLGSIFEYNPMNDSLKIVYKFATNNNGGRPLSSLTEISNGRLMGLRQSMGFTSNGGYFIFDYNNPNSSMNFNFAYPGYFQTPFTCYQANSGHVFTVSTGYNSSNSVNIYNPSTCKAISLQIAQLPYSNIINGNLNKVVSDDSDNVYFYTNTIKNSYYYYYKSFYRYNFGTGILKLLTEVRSDFGPNDELAYSKVAHRLIRLSKDTLNYYRWSLSQFDSKIDSFTSLKVFQDTIKYGYNVGGLYEIPESEFLFIYSYDGGKYGHGVELKFNPITKQIFKIRDNLPTNGIIYNVSPYFDKLFLFYKQRFDDSISSVYSFSKDDVLPVQRGKLKSPWKGQFSQIYYVGDDEFVWICQQSNYPYSKCLLKYNISTKNQKVKQVENQYNAPILLPVYTKPFLLHKLQDTSFCFYDSLEVGINTALTTDIQWFINGRQILGEDSAQLLLAGIKGDSTGNYYCRLSNFFNTAFTDSFHFNLIPREEPLGSDTALWGNESLLLHAGHGFNLTQWSTGATTTTLFMDKYNLHQGNNSIGFVGKRFAGCTIIDTINIQYSPVDINMKGIKIYPNPASEHLSIDFNTNDYGAIKYSIFDISGRAIQGGKLNAANGKNTIFFTQGILNHGSYFLELIPENGEKSVVKFIVD